MQHGVGDAVRDAFIYELDVLFPLTRLAVGADLLHGAEVVVVDLFEFLFDFLLLHVELSVDLLGEFLVADGLGLVTFIDYDAFAFEAVCNGLEVGLHGDHGFVDFFDLGEGTLEEGFDVADPGEGVHTGFEVLIHLDDLREDERALNLVEFALDAVVHEHDLVQSPDVFAVVVGLVLDVEGLLGDLFAELLEVLDLLEQAHEVWVKVHY